MEMTNINAQVPMDFSGSDYSAKKDRARLTGQILRVFNLMKDQKWRTLDEIAMATKDPHASISAQLRNLRKPKFGMHTVEKQARGERSNGLFEYKLTVRVSNDNHQDKML